MSADLMPTPVVIAPGELVLETKDGAFVIPRLITGEGPGASERFTEFFFANIRNKHTRRAYTRQVLQFLRWCDARGLTRLEQVRPLIIAS